MTIVIQEKVLPSEKLCKCCETLKPASEWYRNARTKDGLSSQCKKCNYAHERRRSKDPEARAEKLQRTKNWQANNKVKLARSRRWSNIKAKFGLSKEQYLTLLAKQDGRCAICSTDSPLGWGVFVVDHCHSSGKVRGLLCSNCNTGLGLFKDSVEALTKAITYLSQPTESIP